MRVAFISTGYYPTNSGGGSISTRLITDELQNVGVDVDVFTTTGSHKTLRKISDHHRELPDGTAYRLPKRVGKNYGIVRHSSELSGYDLIHVYGFGSLPGIVTSTSIPVLGTANNLEWACINWAGYLRAGCPEYGFPEAVRLARQAGYTAFLPLKLGLEAAGKRLARRADYYTAQTDGMKEILRRCGYPESEIRTVPNLLDPRFDVEPEEKDAEKNHLVYVGRLIEKKGIEEIVRAYTDLPAEIRDRWKFSIFGDGTLKHRIEGIVATSAADIDIRYCPYEELPSVYREASVLVHGSKYPEPFSRTWLEAMASGTAIVCSKNPSSVSVLEGIAEYYDPFDPQSLTDALQTVLTDPDRRSEMIQRGKEAVDRYRPKEVVPQYKSIYTQLCRGE